MKRAPIFFALVALALSGCATWGSGHVDLKIDKHALSPSDASAIVVTEQDSSKPYQVLGDITVLVNKTTVFNADPSREQVNERLKKEAAKVGADAVIFARYGETGVSFWSWGSLEGKGRAIKYLK